MKEVKRNQVPQLILDFIDQMNSSYLPRFQRDLACATLERIAAVVNEALERAKAAEAKEKRKVKP